MRITCLLVLLASLIYQGNAYFSYGGNSRLRHHRRPALPPGYAYVQVPSSGHRVNSYGGKFQSPGSYEYESQQYENNQPSPGKSLYQDQPSQYAYYDNYQQDPYAAQSSYGSYGTHGHNAYQTQTSQNNYGSHDYNDYQQLASPNNYHYDSHPDMQEHERSYGHRQSYSQPKATYVPVIIKKKKQKKKKIISVQHGFFISGGTQMFGKFKDLYSCQKACAITPTCFAGDFDPWLGKCFMHGNTTACQAMSSHPAIIHFKKVPCSLVETPRGLITLGTQAFRGLEQKGTKDLKSCIKKCATAGGGIAPTPETVATTPQLCFGIDYDFATHKCYLHVDSTLCADPTVITPEQLSPRASSINILLCPRTTK